jgi:carotenoid cleavage dioxygenase-like enzyme
MVLVDRRIGRLVLTLGIALTPLLSGCALRSGSRVDYSTPQQVQQRLDAYALGTIVQVRLESGERVKGMLMWVDTEYVKVEVKPGETYQLARASIVEMSEYTTRERRVGDALMIATGVITLVLVLWAMWLGGGGYPA